jgi:hypothetical protein
MMLLKSLSSKAAEDDDNWGKSPLIASKACVEKSVSSSIFISYSYMPE